MGWQYTPQQSSLQFAGSNLYSEPTTQTIGSPLLYNPQAANTNIAPIYSTETPTNPNSSFWSQFFGAYPSELASTIGGLVNWAITPPGYTQGGTPLAGGQSIDNYTIAKAI
jgi:hypothetical protein